MPYSAERRAGDDRENNGTTPRLQKVLFVKIRPLPLPVLLLPMIWQISSASPTYGLALRFRPQISSVPFTSPMLNGVPFRASRFPPTIWLSSCGSPASILAFPATCLVHGGGSPCIPRLYALHPTLYTLLVNYSRMIRVLFRKKYFS